MVYFFKRFFLFFISLLALFIFTFLSQNFYFSYADFNSNIVEYNGPIYHLFTHCLIANPDIAFAKNNQMRTHYDNDCLTIFEFENILKELYKNNYILVKTNLIFDDTTLPATKKKIFIPQGKKPLILSFDDVNYDRKKSGKGMVDKIALDENKNIITYTNNSTLPSYNNEFITILENFISTHPDFSYNNARGVICLTGYDGILGYRTNRESPTKESEIKKVKPLIHKLKTIGWEFASHSYGHYHMKKISPEKFKDDVDKWKQEVEPLVGKTSIYVYPYGEREITHENNKISEKHQYLEKAGFKLFCGVGIQPFFSYINNKANKKILFMDRTPLDGYTLKNNYKSLSHLFNIKKVYDNRRDIKLKDFYI